MAKTFGSAGMKKTSTDLSHATLPHVVIVGGGFGGLATAKALRNAPVRWVGSLASGVAAWKECDIND
ncbi:MAG TPA: hypothetical protein VGM27_16630 [Acidobacteriaceae bacterium]|jgi:NADH dehydrogenase